jgi:CheY-like chemotaxis protein
VFVTICIPDLFIKQSIHIQISVQNLNMEKQIHILLVDDDSELLESAKEILNLRCNYDVDLASSADVASEKMIQKEYDVIVCDILMPVMDGFEFLKALRESGNKVPFIVFTVTEDKETALKAFRLGANGFVGKYGNPEVVFSTLIKCISEAVNNSREQDTK